MQKSIEDRNECSQVINFSNLHNFRIMQRLISLTGATRFYSTKFISKKLNVRSITTQECITTEYKYGCHNYKPLPVVIAKGKG